VAIWNFTLMKWSQNPVFGMGLGRLWDIDMKTQYAFSHGWSPGYAHNLYYQALGEAGWCGLGAMIVFLLAGLWSALSSRKPLLLAVAFLGLFAMRGITEVTWWGMPYSEIMFSSYLLLILIVGSSRRRTEVDGHPRPAGAVPVRAAAQ
jgi:O-antigen ligase